MMTPNNLKNRNLLTLRPGDGSPTAIDWSPDGTRLVIGDENGNVSLLTAEGRRIWQDQKLSRQVYSLAFAPDGGKIAAAGSSVVLILKAATGQELLRPSSEEPYNPIAWSADSRLLAFDPGMYDDAGPYSIAVMDVMTGRILKRYSGHSNHYYGLAWSPDGRSLASGSADTTIRLWDVETGGCLQVLEGHAGRVSGLAWSPEGLLASSGANDGTVRIWNPLTGECHHRLSASEGDVSSVSWSPDGRLLASSSSEGPIHLWEAESGRLLLRLDGHTKTVHAVAFSPEGNRLASVSDDGALRLWDVSDLVAARSPLSEQPGLAQFCARQAATVGRRATLRQREIWVPHLPGAAGDCLGILGTPDEEDLGRGMALFPNGRTVAIGHLDGGMKCWDLTGPTVMWEGRGGHETKISEVAPSRDGRRLATGDNFGGISIWDAATGRCLAHFNGQRGLVFNLSWSPDGGRLASMSSASPSSLQIWDAESGVCLLTCEGLTRPGEGMGWAPDGRLIASGDDSGEIILWDAATGAHQHRYTPLAEVIWKLCWSPDGRFLLVSYNNGSVIVIEALTGEVRLRCEGHTSGITGLGWSPDGRWLATGGRDRDCTLRVWDARTGEEALRFSFPKNCWQLAWSPDGGFLASAHFDGTVRFWDTRSLLPQAPAIEVRAAHPLSASLQPLPSALAQLHRLGIHPPLSLLRDLLDLTGGRTVEGPLAELGPALRPLRELRWPVAARFGLVALLLHRLPLAGWEPPAETTPTELREALAEALASEPAEPEAPVVPLVPLREAIQRVEDRLLTLLALLGPDAVAADPGLPLRLLTRLPALPALHQAQRRLLGLRVRFGDQRGHSTGSSPGADRAQVSGFEAGRRTDWHALLPSQLALPRDLFNYRYLSGELLFRSREVAEAPRLRPTVLLLDTSPPTFGPVEAITRMAAAIVARTLHQAGLPALLITTGDGESKAEVVRELAQPADWLEVWTQRTLEPASAARSLRLAAALGAHLRREAGEEPRILLLTHPWFGAEEDVPPIAGLRGLFVQYPGQVVRPALAAQCERWTSLAAGQSAELPQILGDLLG